MKKIIAGVLCLFICFAFASCGVDPVIEEKLKTDCWAYEDDVLGTTYIQVFEFYDDGQYKDTLYTKTGSVDNHGTYKIKKDKIVLINEDGNEVILNYVYEDEKLILTKSDGTRLYNIKG